MISLTCRCSNCNYQISGEYEEDEIDSVQFCPSCGRQIQLTAPIPEVEVPTKSAELPELIQRPSHTDLPASPKPVEAAALKANHSVPPVEPVSKSGIPSNRTEPPPSIAAASQIDVRRPDPKPAGPAKVSAAAKPAAIPARNRIAWRFRPAASAKTIVAVRNCVAVDDRGRIIAALGPDLFALVPGATGCEVDWKFSASDRIPASPVIGPTGTVFVHSSDGLLHAIDGNGSPARTPVKVGPALGWATPIVDGGNSVWISASNGGLIRVDAAGQMATRQFYRLPNRLDCTGAMRGNVLYIGSEDQFLHAIDLQGDRGRDRWSQPDKVGLTGWYVNSAIALDDSRIIVTSRDECLYSFNENGTLAWKAELNGRAIGSPIVAPSGLIVLGLTKAGDSDSLSGQMVAFHGKTGQLAWHVEFDAPVESTPVAGDGGEIYFGDNAGKIHAVNIQGQRLWSEPVGSAIRSAGAIVSKGQIVFGLDDGSLVAIRCSSETLGGGWPKLLATMDNRCSTSS